MARYFTSDLHFGHKNVIRFCNRPWPDLQQMEDGLVANWNSTVKKGDSIYVLGDFSFMNQKETRRVLARLNGNKFLVKGNHDHHSAFRHVSDGWKDVFENIQLKLDGGQKVYASHFPYWCGDKPDEDQRYQYKRIVDEGGWLLCGHVHQHWAQKEKQINVGVDVRDYRPISEAEILRIIQNGI